MGSTICLRFSLSFHLSSGLLAQSQQCQLYCQCNRVFKFITLVTWSQCLSCLIYFQWYVPVCYLCQISLCRKIQLGFLHGHISAKSRRFYTHVVFVVAGSFQECEESIALAKFGLMG